MPAARGTSVYKKLLNSENNVLSNVPNRTGRNSLLLLKRDDFLLHRIYFKSSVQRKLYHDVLTELEGEVFLTKRMLQDIIQRKSEELLSIKRNRPSQKELKEKWPHIIWT